MKELTNRLMMFTTNDNALIIDTLVSEIIENDINSLEDLKFLENSYFDKTLSMNDRVNSAYDDMNKDIYKFENMSSKELVLYDELKEKFNNSKHVEERLILIIKMYELLHYQMKFPFCCYSLIVGEKI